MAAYDSADIVVEILSVNPGPLGAFTSNLKLQLFTSWQNGNEDPAQAGNLANPSAALWMPSANTATIATITTTQTYPFAYMIQLPRPFARYLRIGVEFGGFDGAGMTQGALVLFQVYGIGRKGV